MKKLHSKLFALIIGQTPNADGTLTITVDCGHAPAADRFCF